MAATSADFSSGDAGRKIGADPDDPFVELRKELGAEARPSQTAPATITTATATVIRA